MRILEVLGPDQANRTLVEAWWGGKNAGLPRTALNPTGNDDGSGWVLAEIELALIRPNEEPGRYDSTVDPVRASAYAGAQITAPVHLLFGERVARRGAIYAAVMDGGHRVSAARIRGDHVIRAVMRRADYVRLQEVSDRRQSAVPAMAPSAGSSCSSEDGEEGAQLQRPAMR